ncbi:hypothetical protein J6590_058466 [Homalodisca vitripennis]|nr:hypothetical protein J6590_058466 [Homalodisca vitripennis]
MSTAKPSLKDTSYVVTYLNNESLTRWRRLDKPRHTSTNRRLQTQEQRSVLCYPKVSRLYQGLTTTDSPSTNCTNPKELTQGQLLSRDL